jgi:hypothetical protein
MTAALRAEGKAGYLVDPDGVVIGDKSEFEDVRYVTVDDAAAAAEEWLGRAFTRWPSCTKPARPTELVRRTHEG